MACASSPLINVRGSVVVIVDDMTLSRVAVTSQRVML
jgi:hypothetical protein